MQLEPIESSNIAAIGIESGTLRVRFKDGAEYDYPDTSQASFEAFKSSPSKGRWLNQFISERAGVVRSTEPKRDIKGDQFHTTQAEGCCKIHLNNASLSGKLDRVKVFECPTCGAEYIPRPYGSLMLWATESSFAVV